MNEVKKNSQMRTSQPFSSKSELRSKNDGLFVPVLASQKKNTGSKSGRKNIFDSKNILDK
jgi:hypothetical protein